MPANLPPQYYEAQKIFQQAKTSSEKIGALEDMLALMPKHKGTDHLKAELRARIAKLSQQDAQKGVQGKGSAYRVRKEGSVQIALVGPTNSGKSQLFYRLTGVETKIASYPFVTKTPTPGMATIEGVPMQVIDFPPVGSKEAILWFQGNLRSADLLLVVIDLSQEPPEQLKQIFEVLATFRIKPTGWSREEPSQTLAIPKKTLIVGNKSDLDMEAQNYGKLKAQCGDTLQLVSISALEGAGLNELKRKIFEALNIIRVYTKAPGEEPEMSNPLVMEVGDTVEDAAEALHKDFRRKLKHALLWGSSKFDGQMVPRNHVLHDGDILEMHI